MRRIFVALAVIGLSSCASGGATGDDDVTIDARAIDARVIDSSNPPIDGAPIDGAPIDGPAIDGAPTDGAAIDATAIDGTTIDAGTIDGVVTTGNDTCAQALDITAGALVAGGITVTGDTTGHLDDVQIGGCTGFIPDGPDLIYVANVPANKTITAVATPTTSWDISVELVTPCGLATTCLDGADASAGNGAETASYLTTAAQTVYVVVDSWDPGAFGPYSLVVTIQ